MGFSAACEAPVIVDRQHYGRGGAPACYNLRALDRGPLNKAGAGK